MHVNRGVFWGLFGVIAVFIAVFVTWFLGNLLYSLFWKVLSVWRVPVTEGQMTAYIAAHLVPFLLTLLAAGILAWLIRNQLALADEASNKPRAGMTMREYQLRHQEVAAQRAYAEELSRHTAALEVRQRTNEAPRPLSISVGTSLDFYELVREPGRFRLHTSKKQFKIRIDNPNRSKTISGIKVSVTAMSPVDGHRFPWVLADNLLISAGDHEMVPFVVYEERKEPEKYPGNLTCSDTFEIITLDRDRYRLFGIENQYTLQLKCTAAGDISFTDAIIKLSVSGGRLKIEKA